jgi:hypothetical protein
MKTRNKYSLPKKIAIIIGYLALFTTIWQTARIYQEEIQLNDSLAQQIIKLNSELSNRLNKIDLKIHGLDVEVKVLETKQERIAQ